MAARQTAVLVFEDFPSPSMARTLSPNGRAHWAKRFNVGGVVAMTVWERWNQKYGPTNLRIPPPVHVTFRYVFPDRRVRDVDNYSTGVTKKAIDTLRNLGVLEGDDSARLTLDVQIAYEPGRRALELTLDAAEPAEAGR